MQHPLPDGSMFGAPFCTKPFTRKEPDPEHLPNYPRTSGNCELPYSAASA